MTPQVAAGRFLWGVVLGLGLGLWYGFLRPLGRHRRTLSDCLFLFVLFPVWVYFCFAVCDGDFRLGYWVSFLLGGILWDRTAGRLLAPIWQGFWGIIGSIMGFFAKFFKKFTGFLKKPFAYIKKSCTMKMKYCFHIGGHPNDPKQSDKPYPAGVQTQQ